LDFVNQSCHLTGRWKGRTQQYNPSSNDAAENVVRTFKNFLEKNKSSGDIDVDILK